MYNLKHAQKKNFFFAWKWGENMARNMKIRGSNVQTVFAMLMTCSVISKWYQVIKKKKVLQLKERQVEYLRSLVCFHNT